MTRQREATRRLSTPARKVSSTRKRPPRSSDQGLRSAQQSVGQFLRATRESLGMTQAEVADRTQDSPWRLSRAAISAIERGQNFPGLEAMLALSTVLHIDPKELIERARLTSVVPVDITGISDRELEERASRYFWAGEFGRALSVYDAMAEKLALESPARDEAAARLAALEVRRATTLKRIGALISAIGSIERAISLSSNLPATQAEAYVVLADLQSQRGHLPLARDAARRAIELARQADPRRLIWAHMVLGKTLFLDGDFEGARREFAESLTSAESVGDRQHVSHLSGNIGSCHQALGDLDQAFEWVERAVSEARAQRQPALVASWLVELGKIELARDRPDEADRLAREALELARRREHRLTVFRAEWLRDRVARRAGAERMDSRRAALLDELYRQLDDHEGVDEIVEYRQSERPGKAR